MPNVLNVIFKHIKARKISSFRHLSFKWHLDFLIALLSWAWKKHEKKNLYPKGQCLWCHVWCFLNVSCQLILKSIGTIILGLLSPINYNLKSIVIQLEIYLWRKDDNELCDIRHFTRKPVFEVHRMKTLTSCV